MKIIVSKQAVKEYIKEVMAAPMPGWQSTGDMSTSPAAVSAIVDPSAAATDPGNPNFKPKNRVELHTSIDTMINDISDDDAESFYNIIQDTLKKAKEEDENMSDKKVEESIRVIIRKLLKEAEIPLVKKIPMGVHGGEFAQNLEKRKTNLRSAMGKWRDDDDAAPMVRADEPVAGRERKNVMQTDVGGSSFKEIAAELGYASESGAKQAAEKALTKIKFVSGMDQDELEILSLEAMSEYIDFLNKTGELTSADVQLMKDHPTITAELDGFREFFNKYVKRAMRDSKSEIEEEVID